MVTRFFLGLFEAGCLPLFSVITSQWYLRSEQPLRVALWYSGNGMTNIVCAALAFALGKINSNVVHSWQLIFIVFGVVTTLTAPVIYWKLDSDVPSARFLTLDEKRKTIQRLKANQTGTGSTEFKWDQVREAFLDPKTYFWIAMTTLLNVGASVTTIFGPLVISGLGFGRDMTSLLNMPFGAVQIIVILIGSWCAYKLRIKGVIFMAMIIPVIIGLVLL
jgi:MFS family permease